MTPEFSSTAPRDAIRFPEESMHIIFCRYPNRHLRYEVLIYYIWIATGGAASNQETDE